MEIKQYQKILVNLDPTVGAEIQKTRPCVVISPPEMNQHLKTIIIAPVTSAIKIYPTRVNITHRDTINQIVLDQIRTINKKRIVKTFDLLSKEEISEIKAIIKEMLVD
ncbi:MAG: growth inhibitor PemK [Marinilabiliales bacterium]|nr:MAG: growth inhibitor PemK [Marinilabiliales bacterium]